MHGIGNDYVYFDCFEKALPSPSALAVRLSDRRRSIGGDGIVLILPSAVADAKMRMFNADGSEGKMCGNAARCIAKYLYEVRGIARDTLTLETRAGIKTLYPRVRDGSVVSVTVDMGRAEFSPEKIPVLMDGPRAVARRLTAAGENFQVTCVSMGNPHCVIFCEDPYAVPLEKFGPAIERHAAFPEGVNVEFVQVKAENELVMRVWERGSGETFACGTGACAAVAAALAEGKIGGGETVVHLRGGDLSVSCTAETVLMTGPAEIAFTGEVEL